MHAFKIRSAILALAIGLISTISAQAATTIYIYEGESFDQVDPGIGEVTRISASLTVPNRIPPNSTASFNFENGPPFNFSEFLITDGVTTITEQDIGDYLGSFLLFTDDNGDVVEWGVAAQKQLRTEPGHLFIGTAWAPSIPNAKRQDETIYCVAEPSSDSCDSRIALVLDNPGTWSIVPVPAALWLFGSALALLGYLKCSVTCETKIGK